MKRIIISCFFIACANLLNAQTVNDIPLKEIDVAYVQIVGTSKLLTNKLTIDIDFGEEKSFWRDTRLKNEGGKVKKFNTIVDALNYMGREGWIFINAFPVRMGETEIYHFAFRKQFTRSNLLSE